MMKVIKSKKALVLLAVLVVVGAAAIGAYAYFTSTGNGTSSAGTVGSATTWGVNGGSIVGTLYPDATAAGGADQGVITGASVTNNATNGNQNLNKIVATIVSVTQGPTNYPLEAACSATDFQFNSPTSTWSGTGTQTATILPNDDLAPAGVYHISDLNVVLVDDLAPQDNCQGATVKVRFDAS
jgi:hypothetical protein